MEANECETSHRRSDVLLPPRKRLLAGLRRQSLSSISSPLSGYDFRLQNLLKSHKNGSDMSPEEIAEAAGSAAVAAAKAAKAARALADEKAAIAANAVAAAQSALNLAASFSKETSGRERCSKKIKIKKHVQVQQLYENHQAVENSRIGEDLARKLHRAINSSPRTDLALKKLKISHSDENNRSPNTVTDRNGKFVKRESDSEIDCKAESPDVQINGGTRIKPRKLLISFCSLKDKANPKSELKQSKSDLAKPTADLAKPLSSVELAPRRKCQDFNVSRCIEPSKVAQP